MVLNTNGPKYLCIKSRFKFFKVKIIQRLQNMNDEVRYHIINIIYSQGLIFLIYIKLFKNSFSEQESRIIELFYTNERNIVF